MPASCWLATPQPLPCALPPSPLTSPLSASAPAGSKFALPDEGEEGGAGAEEQLTHLGRSLAELNDVGVSAYPPRLASAPQTATLLSARR